MQTNEQSVVNETNKIELLKQEYLQAIEIFRSSSKSCGGDDRMRRFLACQQRGTALFNHIENFVGNSGLLGAHNNGIWVTGFAELCCSYLQSLIGHFKFLRSYQDEFPLIVETIEPTETAYANMQRMVVEYLPPSTATSLRNAFVDHNLPIMGFDVPAASSATPRWQTITGFVVGLIFVLSGVVSAIFFPEPTVYQQFTFRGMFAIGLAAMAPIIPGFVNFTSKVGGKAGYMTIVAGGSIAIFLIIWMVNPPKL